jgi:hypothetical protein
VLLEPGPPPFDLGDDLNGPEYLAKIGNEYLDHANLTDHDIGCPFFQRTLLNHGKNNDQGLWMLTGLACTFMRDGRALFHEMSKGYKTYSREETDQMYDRKENDRESNSLGWPSCKAFRQYGSEQCATCQHFEKIKSPLTLALPFTVPSQQEILLPVNERKADPVLAVMKLHQQGAPESMLFAVLNRSYAVVRNGSDVIIAIIKDDDLILMKLENFHKMFANVRLPRGNKSVVVSKLWFEDLKRRQYLDHGIVFEPGGPLEVEDDRLNLWRGFGVEPKVGDWSLLRNHIFNVLCLGHQELYDYLIKWMALGVQCPNEPIGVAVALRGSPGAGKGVFARTFGKIFGKHFAHIANGDQLTGRFNASVATSCMIFLDEAFWAGEKKAEGVLKALITEPRLQLEAKFRDPIMVDNRLRIIVASNNDWVVPAGMGDRRWLILDVADSYAGTEHAGYLNALYAEIENGGAAALFHDLLRIDLTGFNVRAVPHTVAKAHQQVLSLHGPAAWLYDVLQEGRIGSQDWSTNELTIDTDMAYTCYEDFSKRRREFKPEIKAVWSKALRAMLGPCLRDTRPQNASGRHRAFQFGLLPDRREQFARHIKAPHFEWEPIDHPNERS